MPTRESDKMNDGGQNYVKAVAPDALAAIVDTGLFYPCCGQDLDVPILLFASTVSDFYFVDLRKPRRPDIHDVARLKPSDRQINHADAFVHLASGRDFVFTVSRIAPRPFSTHCPSSACSSSRRQSSRRRGLERHSLAGW